MVILIKQFNVVGIIKNLSLKVTSEQKLWFIYITLEP